jgi:hypothetical protein
MDRSKAELLSAGICVGEVIPPSDAGEACYRPRFREAEVVHLAGTPAFAKVLAPLRRKRWFVYAKEPFAGPKAVLAYLSRYTHRVAISNSRLIKADASGVMFRVKNYRAGGAARYTAMTLDPHCTTRSRSLTSKPFPARRR